MPTLNIVYYNPFDVNEEAFVTQQWCALDKCADDITRLYEGMRQWRQDPNRLIPHYDAVDSAYYPDMASASWRTGLTAWGLMVVRNLQRKYWHCQQPATAAGEEDGQHSANS